jgi:tetratricopeptide (TPR) repeat protein
MAFKTALRPEHAGSHFQCVTQGVIDALQRAYRAGADLGHVIPDIDAETAAVIVAETLEADRVWNLPPEQFLRGVDKGLMSDFKRAALAEIAFGVVDVAREHNDKGEESKWWVIAMASLDEIYQSPTASPLLWYEDIYLDLAYATRGDPDRKAIAWVKRALAYDLRYHKGRNVANLLRDLAEMHLAVGDLDRGLAILTALLQHSPDDIWTYNSMAITFANYGLTELGAQATRRGLELIDARGDPEKLHAQLEDCLAEMPKSEQHGREAEVKPEVLADLRAALSHGFDGGQPREPSALCRQLVPDLDKIPVKRPMKPSDLPLPRVTAAAPSVEPPNRNDPCWCGSGKKYKSCHMAADQKRGR